MITSIKNDNLPYDPLIIMSWRLKEHSDNDQAYLSYEGWPDVYIKGINHSHNWSDWK